VKNIGLLMRVSRITRQIVDERADSNLKVFLLFLLIIGRKADGRGEFRERMRTPLSPIINP